MSHKVEQMAAAIQRAVQQVIAKGLQDPRVSGLITIIDVRVTRDLAQAVISFSVLPQDREELVLHGLQTAANYIRREVGEIVRSRSMPQFVFKLDRSLKKQAAVLADINRASDELRARGIAPEPADEGPAPTQEEAPQ
ncbi:MAG: 30S ribosome-binding factor RbfA [Phycisphaerales bacterium]